MTTHETGADSAAPEQLDRRQAPKVSRLRGDRGATSAFIMMLLPALVGLAGLAFDGGMLFTGRREAYNVAAAAARAGANDLFEPSIYAGNPELAGSAPGTAIGFANGQGVSSATATALGPQLLEVTVTQDVDMLFLGIFGIGTQTVTATAQSRVRSGVTG